MLHIEARDHCKPFPNFGKPKIIGYIGIENLKYARRIKDEKVNFDLNLHLNKVKRKPPDLDVKLTDLLKFLIEHEARLNFPLEKSLGAAKFFCYRGLLTCVACTPYENREPWKIVAILYKGNIYLCARDTEAKRQQKLHMSKKDKKFTSWGYKFEQYMLSDRPDVEPNPNQPVDETEEFSLVFRTHLNHHKIIYGAEMDGIRCDKRPVSPLPDAQVNPENIVQYLSCNEFIELKTSRHIEFSRQEINFKRLKTKKWWCQSFLVGIDTLVCGYRNDDGIVEELKVYNVKDLAKTSQKYWKPNVCLNFLDAFLTFVKQCLARKIKHKFGQKALNNLQALPMTCLLFEWTPNSSVQVSDNYCHEDDPILLEWFIENFGKPVTDVENLSKEKIWIRADFSNSWLELVPPVQLLYLFVLMPVAQLLTT